MSFISLEFLILLLVVFVGYWSLQASSLRAQNIFLLLVSYLFYAWGDWRFLALLIANSSLIYLLARSIQSSTLPKHRKILLWIGILFNVVILGYFKYFNFFADSAIHFLNMIGLHAEPYTLKLLLPLGISYFTFKSLSYLIEVYRGKLEATHDVTAYFTYIGFFPQLVAGPIDRPANLLTQLLACRQFVLTDIYWGMKQGVWGLFKKVVVADNLAVLVDRTFNNYASRGGLELVIGAIFFSIQIYCDFSGYSDMANGLARMLGFKPMENFAQPYFSRDIAEFWRRWHISLSSWFRDYIFYQLGGGMGSKWKAIRNTLITFTLSGLWHGANWTFVIWGFLHGLLFLPIIFGIQPTHTKKIAYKRWLPRPLEAVKVTITFTIVTILWVLFRSVNIDQAYHYLVRIADSPFFTMSGDKVEYLSLGFWVIILLVLDWIGREKNTPLDIGFSNRYLRWVFYSAFLLIILMRGRFHDTPFLYAQF